ncbi:MAG: 23S rRNA (uracil(1939)-C(5))-methyltransferase RlmD [Lachnospiraceae bacterium]|nr:23S rRNA (uracil(1939)-C(5))-methyltransferase RlmD [Lachnospiraceae bacterium]
MPTYKKEKLQKKASSPRSTGQGSKRDKAPETGRRDSVKTACAAKKPASKSLCPIEKKCGGCTLLSVPYEKQLEQKLDALTKTLAGVAKPERIIGAAHPLHYRNKITATFGRDKNGVILGLYEEKSHRVVQNDGCLIEDERAAAVLATIKKLVASFKLTVYSEVSGYGLLKHVQIRTSRTTNEMMVVLVCAGPVFPSKNNFAKALKTAHPEITTLVLNINDKDTTMVLGERNITVFGPGFIEDELCGNRYRISPGSFYQVNPEQTKVLYETAIDFAGLTGREHVVDAYCGTGTIALSAAAKCGRVTGVELNRTAVKDAVRNAKANNIENAIFIAGDAGKYLTECAANSEKIDVVFMDPPRSGSTSEFIMSCVKLAPSRIVYVSCEPTTLARDLALFKRHGYIAAKCVGVDMFPQTENCEVICCLYHQK